MPILPVTQQQLRVPTQLTAGRTIRNVGAAIADVFYKREEEANELQRKQEKNAYNRATIEAKNEIDRYTNDFINNPGEANPVDYSAVVDDIITQHGEGLTDEMREDYLLKMSVPATQYKIQTTNAFSKRQIDEGVKLLGMQVEGLATEPYETRNLSLAAHLAEAVEEGFIHPSQVNDWFDTAMLNFSMVDADRSAADALAVIQALEQNDDIYSFIDPLEKNKALDHAKRTYNRLSQAESMRLEQSKTGTMQELARGIFEGSEREIYFATEQAVEQGLLLRPEANSIQLAASRERGVTYETNARTFTELSIALNTISPPRDLGGYSGKRKQRAEDFNNYMAAVRDLYTKANNAYGEGKLTYKNYSQIIEDIDRKTARHNALMAGEILGEEPALWRRKTPFFSENNEAIYQGYLNSVGGSQEKADKLFLQYKSAEYEANLRGEEVPPEELFRAVWDQNAAQKQEEMTKIAVDFMHYKGKGPERYRKQVSAGKISGGSPLGTTEILKQAGVSMQQVEAKAAELGITVDDVIAQIREQL